MDVFQFHEHHAVRTHLLHQRDFPFKQIHTHHRFVSDPGIVWLRSALVELFAHLVA